MPKRAGNDVLYSQATVPYSFSDNLEINMAAISSHIIKTKEILRTHHPSPPPTLQTQTQKSFSQKLFLDWRLKERFHFYCYKPPILEFVILVWLETCDIHSHPNKSSKKCILNKYKVSVINRILHYYGFFVYWVDSGKKPFIIKNIQVFQICEHFNIPVTMHLN